MTSTCGSKDRLIASLQRGFLCYNLLSPQAKIMFGTIAALSYCAVVRDLRLHPCAVILTDSNEAIHTSPPPLSPHLACDAGPLLLLPPFPRSQH